MTISSALATTQPSGYPRSVRTLDFFERRALPRLQRATIKPLRQALAVYLAAELSRPIRSVVAYQEHTVSGGGCSTCEFNYIILDVYFKDSSGRTFLWRYEGYLSEIIAKLAEYAEPAGS